MSKTVTNLMIDGFLTNTQWKNAFKAFRSGKGGRRDSFTVFILFWPLSERDTFSKIFDRIKAILFAF
jgi:hypothetical protein